MVPLVAYSGLAVDQGDLQIVGLGGCAQQDDGNSLND